MSLAGFSTNVFSEAYAYSVKIPLLNADRFPNTSFSGWNCITLLPTTSIHHAIPAPRTLFIALRKTSPIRRAKKGLAIRRCQSASLRELCKLLAVLHCPLEQIFLPLSFEERPKTIFSVYDRFHTRSLNLLS